MQERLHEVHRVCLVSFARFRSLRCRLQASASLWPCDQISELSQLTGVTPLTAFGEWQPSCCILLLFWGMYILSHVKRLVSHRWRTLHFPSGPVSRWCRQHIRENSYRGLNGKKGKTGLVLSVSTLRVKILVLVLLQERGLVLVSLWLEKGSMGSVSQGYFPKI